MFHQRSNGTGSSVIGPRVLLEEHDVFRPTQHHPHPPVVDFNIQLWIQLKITNATFLPCMS